MTEMDHPMGLESLLPDRKDLDKSIVAARAREMQEVVLEDGVVENSVNPPASGSMEVTDQVVVLETSPPTPTHSLVSKDRSKHGDGTQSELGQDEDLAFPMKPSASELPFESPSISSPNSGNFNDNAVEETGAVQRKRKSRGKYWAECSDDLFRAVLDTRKVSTPMEQGADSKLHGDACSREDVKRRKRDHESDVIDSSQYTRGCSLSRKEMEYEKDRKERKGLRKEKRKDKERRRKNTRGFHLSRKEMEHEKDRKERKRLRKEKRKDKERRQEKEKLDESSSGSELDVVVKPEDVVVEIYSNFRSEAKDLGQVLEMIDSGQAVDVSSLPNRGLVVLLKKLFSALNLSSLAGTHLLPQGAESTMKRLAPIFNKLAATTARTPAVSAVIRVMGPAVPSADMLAAAARLSEAEARLREAELELENDPLIGPAPATVVAEAASANDAERFEEVTRMLSRDVKNAYDLLGVKSDVEPAVLKKKYWKLSLLVHPDKCDHPQAHEAFMALNKAFKDLQDPTKKAEIDRKVAEDVAREEFAAELQAKREAAQWRRLRGEEEEGDDELLRGPQEVARDEWMTRLPPERQAGGPPAQQNTFFSKSEKSGRGDTSIWTDTPADKAQKAKMQYLEVYKQAALTYGPAEELEEREKERAAKEAELMDSYNSHKRSQSLVEKHQAERAAGGKKKKTKKVDEEGGFVKSGGVEKEPEWKVNHPWKPWDREKDIAAGRKSVNLDPKNFKEALSSRFGGFTDSEPRKFL